MDDDRGRRFRTFLIGGLVGSAAGAAAAARMAAKRRPRKRSTPAGLAAFEEAPCYREIVEQEAANEPR